jgi:hypothetical protein
VEVDVSGSESKSLELSTESVVSVEEGMEKDLTEGGGDGGGRANQKAYHGSNSEDEDVDNDDEEDSDDDDMMETIRRVD